MPIATRRAALAGAAAGLAAPAVAQASYPSRPVRLVVPFPPGASTDAVGRLTAERLSEHLGQPFVVENRGGAGGLIGAEAAARAAPDGHTLLIATISVTTMAPHLTPRLSWDPMRELVNIACSCLVTNAVLARPDLPVRDAADLIAHAKARPDALSYGSPGNATSGHLCAEYLKFRAGIGMVHVPYRGTAPLLADLLAGRLDLAVDNLSFYLPHVREGRLKLLAVTSPGRWFSVPDTPTVAEGPLPGFASTPWWGVQAPLGTPPTALERVEAATVAAFAEPATRARLREIGIEAAPLGAADFGRLVAAEHAKWGEVVRAANIRTD